MTPSTRRAVVAVLMSWATPALGQLPDTTTYSAVAVSGHPRGTVVSAVVRIPVGSGHDPEGLEGTAWMLGELLAHRANDAVGHEARVVVEVDRLESRYTLLALPGVWEESWRRLEDVLFREPVTDADVERHREEALDALRFTAGSPVRNFDVESARLVAPPSHPWARAVVGTVETVERLAPAALDAFKRDTYRSRQATVAVVGPRAHIPGGGGPRASARPDTSGRSDTGLPAWQTEDRSVLVQDVTNSWVTVAWPVAPDTPRTALEFLAHLLQEELDPDPPDPDRFSVDVRLVDAPGGVVLMVEAAVFPEAADRWEARILGAKDALTRRRMDTDFLGWRRRRFRTARLLAEAAPEAEAARLAEDLSRNGRIRDLSVEIWELDGARLLTAAEALGPPRILRLGPDLVDGGGTR